MSRGFLRKSSVNTFIGIVWILFAVSASAQNAVSKFRADSIRQSLSCIQKPQDKIPLLEGDAHEILPQLDDEYDMVFMDAAKGQYRRLFEE